MGSFGDRLRREREQRGISLEDIALTTKIRAGLLQALEEEKFDRLPGGIFNKGFVRAYARHLGLDEDQAVADYLVASGEGPVRRPGENQPGVRGETQEPRIQLVRDESDSDLKAGSSPGTKGVLAGLLVLVIVGAVAWLYYHREKLESAPASEPAAVTSPANPTSVNPTPPGPSPAGPSSASPSAVSPSAAPPPAVQPMPPSTSAPIAPAAPSRTPLASPTAPSTEATTAGTFTVGLKAEEDCWLQITADGKSEEITMDPGLTRVITAKNRVTVRAGSVGALNISFNGKPLPSQGDYGQVRTLVFTPSGLLPPAPKPITPPPTGLP
jgi:cytoskeleton protein RodZ